MKIQAHLIIALAIFVPVIFNSQIDTEKQKHQARLRQLELSIMSTQRSRIYPFSEKQKRSIVDCGAIPSLKIVSQQQLYIQANQPFIAIIQSQQQSIRLSGYGESQPSSLPSMSVVHQARMIVLRQCENYFSSQHFMADLLIYPKPLEERSQSFEEPILVRLSSFTFCLEQTQLVSLQRAFDTGYSILIAIVISMLPAFVIGKLRYQLPIIAVLLASQKVSMVRGAFIIFVCMLAVQSNKLIRYSQLQPEQQKTLKLWKASLASLTLFYSLSYIVTQFNNPNPSTANSSSIPLIYSIGMYITNVCEILIITQMVASILWLNRFRGLFWWLAAALAIVGAKSAYGESVGLTDHDFGLVLPGVFAQSCQFRPMLSIILMVPACQFLDRFNKVKFGGLIVLTSVALVGAYSEFLGMLVGAGCVLGWLAIVLAQQGEYRVFNRTWLKINEIRAVV